MCNAHALVLALKDRSALALKDKGALAFAFVVQIKGAFALVGKKCHSVALALKDKRYSCSCGKK